MADNDSIFEGPLRSIFREEGKDVHKRESARQKLKERRGISSRPRKSGIVGWGVRVRLVRESVDLC